MKDNLFDKTISGLQWTSISTITTILVQILNMVIVSRLLGSKEFGIVTLSNSIVDFGYFFATMGLGQALVQKENLTEIDIRALFTLSLILGISIFGILWIFMPFFITYLYPGSDIDLLITVARFLSLTILLYSLSMIQGAIVKRNFDFKRNAITSIIISVVSSFLVITFAYFEFGVWSLVIGTLWQSTASLLVNLYLSKRWVIIPIFNMQAFKPFLVYGGNLSLNSIIEYVNQTMDTVLIGRFSGDAKVGIYRRVNMLFYLPSYHLTTTITRVLFPAMSRMQGDKPKMRENFLRLVFFLSIIIFPLAGGIAVAAENVILIALGTKQNWVSGADLLRVYGFASVLNMITMQSGIVCDATAQLKPKLILNVCYFFVVCALFYLFRGYDLIGYAYALLIAEIIRNIAYIYLMRRILQLDYYTYYKSLLPALVICAFVSSFIYGATTIAGYLQLNYIITFVVQVSTGAIALGLAMFLPIPLLHRQMEWILKKLSSVYSNPKISKIVNWYIRFLNNQTKPI